MGLPAMGVFTSMVVSLYSHHGDAMCISAFYGFKWNRFLPAILASILLTTPAFGQLAGDNFIDSILLTGLSGALSASNVNATAEIGEPIHAETLANHSMWFNWTAPATGGIAFDTADSTFDTVLAVYTGVSLTNLTAVATNNDVSLSNTTSRLVFRATAGTTYQILVDGASGTSGNFNLSWSGGSPTNDDFTNAQILLPESGHLAGSTYIATREPGEPLHFNDNPGGHSVWFQWTAPIDEYLTVDTFGSSFDTLLAVYSGTNITSLARLGSSDDFFEFTTNKAGRVTIPVAASNSYFIAIDGFNGAYGNFILNWQATVLLKMALTNANQFILSWPANSSGFVLESSLAVPNTNNWSVVTNTPIVAGSDWTVTVLRQTNAVFFRLRKS